MSAQAKLEGVDNQEDWDDTFDIFSDNDGTAYDLTDATAITFTVWDGADTSALLSATIGDGVTINNPATAGSITIHFDADDLGSLTPGEYRFSLRAVISGTIRTLILGTVPILDGGP